MAIKRDVAGVKTDITILKRRSNGAWVDCLYQMRAQRRDTGAWVDCLPLAPSGTLTATSDKSTVTKFDSCIGLSCPTVKTVTTAAVTVTSSGGSGAGPTYQWEYVSGSSNIEVTAPTANSTTFYANLPRNTTQNAQWKCVVTRGVDTVEVFVSVTVGYIYSEA